MRLGGQQKGGFYACPPQAVAMAASMLSAPQPTALLDPCCGEGAAVMQLKAALGGNVTAFGVELEPGRAAVCRGHKGLTFLGPADFLTAAVSGQCFGMAWVNPPFDDELGQNGRVETTFLARCTQLLCKGGVVALVMPERRFGYEQRRLMSAWYEDVCVAPFPAECRRYDEIIVFGRKLSSPVEADYRPWSAVCKAGRLAYALPASNGPRRFEKVELTDTETMAALAQSPLRTLFRPPTPMPAPSPPLELSKGQMALVLAGGFLNTTLQRPGEAPVLIKATPYKEDYLKESTEEVRQEGTENEHTVTVNVYGQRIKLLVRVASQDGTIHDLK